MEKLISVILPCYNMEEYIDRCMESLLTQTIGLENLELIFVNDASTDSTYERLLEYEKQYSDSIMVVNQSENRKQGAARNAGMQYASGKYIGFCDPDDWAEPDMFEVMYNAIKDTDADYVVCARYDEYADGHRGISGPEADEILDLSGKLYKQLMCDEYAYGGVYQHLFRREFLGRADVWFPEMIRYEDNYFLGILIYYANKIVTVKKPLYHYMINLGSTLQGKNKMWHLDRLKSELMRIDELERRGLLEVYRTDIECRFLMIFFVNTINILVSKFDEIPQGVIKEMQRVVKQLFPNWRQNVLFREYSTKKIKAIAELIDYPFLLGNRKEVLLAYNQMCQRDEEELLK